MHGAIPLNRTVTTGLSAQIVYAGHHRLYVPILDLCDTKHTLALFTSRFVLSAAFVGKSNNSENLNSEPIVPEVVIQRLPLYVRVLSQYSNSDRDVISSEQLGERLQMTPTQIRKDLSYFGRFGKQGHGYDVTILEQKLRTILGLDRAWNAAIIGMGRLGRAVVSYPGFAPEGFNILAAFDTNENIVGQNISGLQVRSISQLATIVKKLDIKIGIVSVPIEHAQEVIDTLVKSGIQSILNYAPLSPEVPASVNVNSIDPVLSLQSMTYYMK